MLSALVLLCSAPAWPQTVPEGWKIIKDVKAVCQIAVPPEWAPFGDNTGAAVLHDPTVAIAAVTSQPGQEFKPLPAGLVKIMGIPKEKMFENSATRIFYQDRTSRGPGDANAFSSAVPARGGTCSCHVVVLPDVGEDVAKKIALSLSGAVDKT